MTIARSPNSALTLTLSSLFLAWEGSLEETDTSWYPYPLLQIPGLLLVGVFRKNRFRLFRVHTHLFFGRGWTSYPAKSGHWV